MNGRQRFWRSGDPFIWLTGSAVAIALLMVAGLVGLILVNGLGFFWPAEVVRLTLADGAVLTGQIAQRETIPGQAGQYRIKLKVANRDLYGADFLWVDEAKIARRERPADVLVIERTEWGLLIGTIREIREGGSAVLLVEEKAREVMALADTVAFMELGRIIWIGPREEADADQLAAAYLGSERT